MFKSIITLALVACLGLSVIAAPSQTGVSKDFDFGGLLCDACKSIVTQVQTELPEMRSQLDQLCQNCGSPENNKKCLDKLHEVEDKLEHMSAQDVCSRVGLCRPAEDSKTFYDFSGQF